MCGSERDPGRTGSCRLAPIPCPPPHNPAEFIACGHGRHVRLIRLLRTNQEEIRGCRAPLRATVSTDPLLSGRLPKTPSSAKRIARGERGEEGDGNLSKWGTTYLGRRTRRATRRRMRRHRRGRRAPDTRPARSHQLLRHLLLRRRIRTPSPRTPATPLAGRLSYRGTAKGPDSFRC